MSITLILHDENKKTLSGYIWSVFLFFSILMFNILDISLVNFDEKVLMNKTLFTLTISSFVALGLITVRPEKFFSKFLFNINKVSLYFTPNEKLSISKALDSPFLSKEIDNFWGNIFVGFGFLIGILFPLEKLISLDEITLSIMNIIKTLFCLIIGSYLVFYYPVSNKKSLRQRIEITWRYLSTISHSKWKRFYSEEVISLEDSLKLGLWSKAKSQVSELNSLYVIALNDIVGDISWMDRPFRFLMGEKNYKKDYTEFINKFSTIKENYIKAKILGLDFTDKDRVEKLTLRFNQFEKIQQKYEDHLNQARQDYRPLGSNLQKEGYFVDKNLIEKFENFISPSYYHIEPIEFELDDFNEILKGILQLDNELLKNMLNNIEDPLELFRRLYKNPRENFQIDKQLIFGTDNFEKEKKLIVSDFMKIASWLSDLEYLEYSTQKLIQSGVFDKLVSPNK